jgi:hypothetical protein
MLRNGVVAAAAPGMASRNALGREPAPTEHSMLYDGLLGITGASGRVAARGRQHGGDHKLIQPDGSQQR